MTGNFEKLRQEARDALPAELLPEELGKRMHLRLARPNLIIEFVVEKPKTAFQFWMEDKLRKNGAYPTEPHKEWEEFTSKTARSRQFPFREKAFQSRCQWLTDTKEFWAKYGL